MVIFNAHTQAGPIRLHVASRFAIGDIASTDRSMSSSR
jgi:hypothetical protein